MKAAAARQYVIGAQAHNPATGEKLLQGLDRCPVVCGAVERHDHCRVADVEIHVAGRDDLAVAFDHSGRRDGHHLQVGIEQMGRSDGPAAVSTFTAVIERRPDFAEGWNKRATVYFLMGEYEKSLQDCHEVIKRNPSHFGALAGYGQIYLALDQPERALSYFRQALRVNPNLRGVARMIPQLERALMERRKGTI